MELTKYEHACFTVEKEGKTIIVDPGGFTTDLTTLPAVVAIIITHEHGDHFDEELIATIISSHPRAVIMATQSVTSKMNQYETRTVKGGDSFAYEGFDLDFYGEDHARIHPDIELVENIGVMIEDRLYYPGDSFTIPEKSVDTLALPIGAPWLKASEAIEFMKAIGARLTFPTHDATLSTTGKGVYDRVIGNFAEAAGTQYVRIDGQTIEID
jgi:L-ascorbate metabolism protein UlaG (beta-lactamase superfamily)